MLIPSRGSWRALLGALAAAAVTLTAIAIPAPASAAAKKDTTAPKASFSLALKADSPAMPPHPDRSGPNITASGAPGVIGGGLGLVPPIGGARV